MKTTAHLSHRASLHVLVLEVSGPVSSIDVYLYEANAKLIGAVWQHRSSTNSGGIACSAAHVIIFFVQPSSAKLYDKPGEASSYHMYTYKHLWHFSEQF